MSIRDITLMGHPALMTPAAPVDDPLSEATTSLIEDMFDTMFAIGGVGIAAPQIGVSQRVIICLMRERKFNRCSLPLISRRGSRVIRKFG